ncbi:TPA: ead/Ea22-like family protein [Escherichia coli]|nr:ead/Ea22-like family protein [Escherichia coli]
MHDDWGFDTDLFHELVTPSIVQALLDEREAQSKHVAELEANLSAMTEDHQKATESIKQADSAVKLAHETFSALAAENAKLKKFCKDAAFDADYEAESGMERGGFSDALNEIKITATDAFLAEVRAQGVDAAIDAAKNLVAQEYEYKDFKAAQSDCCMFPGSDLVGKVEMTEWLADFAAELRKGGNQ